jgi:hypothetical protein
VSAAEKSHTRSASVDVLPIPGLTGLARVIAEAYCHGLIVAAEDADMVREAELSRLARRNTLSVST